MAMLNHYMSKEDVLDILFANRNKAYGAYLLRREYPARLKKSMALMLGGMILLGAGLEWKTAHQRIPVIYPHETLHPTIVNLQPPPKDKPIEHPIVKPVTPHVTPPKPLAVAPPTVALTPPKLVDLPDPSRNLPPISKTEDIQVGVTTTKGDGNPAQVATSNAGEAKAGTEPEAGEEGIRRFVEQMPMFPGGEEALRKYLMRNLETPDELDEGSQKRVVVRFVVDRDGTISACAVTQSGGTVFDEEVLRVVKRMPKWKPGIQNGQAVPVYFNLPVVFTRQ